MTIKKTTNGYIALMATIVISLVLLVMTVEEGSSGWYARFNILGTEAKEQASSLAEGCAEQAQAMLLTDPNFVGNTVTTNANGTCSILPIQFNYPVAGLVTIKTQGVVRNSYANLDMAMNMNDIHLNAIPSAPTSGTLFITTHVINDSSGTLTAGNFTMTVAAPAPAPANFSGTETGVAVQVKAGAYSVSEVSIPANYAKSTTGNCAGNIANGEVKFCTITYDDITTTLTLIANVKNDNSATNIPTDFTMYLDGTAVTLGAKTNVTIGTHTVKAVVLSGYSSSPWGYDCTDSGLSGGFQNGTITIAQNQNKTCVVNFDDNPPPAPSCADTVMILDRTGSMSYNSDAPINSDMEFERVAANSLVNLYAGVLPPATPPQIGVGSIGGLYGNTPAQVPDNTHPITGWLTTVYSKITSAVTTMTSSNSSVGSDLSAGINAAATELNSSRHIAGKQKVLILVSDGDPNQPSGSTTYDTGYNSPTLDAQNAVSELWSNPTGAYTNGGTDANDPVSENDHHQFYKFGFNSTTTGLPSGVTVSGIEASVDAWATAGGSSVTTGTLAPTAMGTYDQWTSNSGSDVSAVNSNNGDTSYIDTSASIDTFGVTNASVPAGGTINSVTITTIARGTVAGATMQIVAEKGGTLSTGSTNTLTTSYATYTRTMATDPTGATWTLAEVNAWTTKFGVRTTQGQSTRVSQIYVTVNYTPSGTNTGFLSPSNQSSDTGGAGNGFENSPTNTFADDSSRAQNVNGNGDRHRFFNYGISIPNGATVTGIEVRPDWWVDSTSGTNSVDVELSWNAGTSWTSKKNEGTETTNDTNNKIVGATNDTWSHSWNIATDFTNTNFRVRLTTNYTSGSRTFSLDWIPVRISYTLPATNTGNLYPISTGSYDQWTPNTGTDISAVGSADATDTTYIDTATNIETFAIGNAGIPAGSTITSVTITAVAKGNPANATIQLVAEKSGTISIGPNITVTSGSYNTYTRVMNTDTAGNPWTLSEVNSWATNFGVRTTNGANTPRVTQIFVTVTYTAPGATSCQLGMDLSWNGGVTWTTEKIQNLTGTEAAYILGASNDDWSGSHTWAPTEFSDTNFRARVRAIDPGASCDNTAVDHLDWLQLKVHYTQNVDPIQAALNAADTAKISGIDIFTIHFGGDTGPYAGKKLLANLATGNTAVSYQSVTHQNGSLSDGTGGSQTDAGPLPPTTTIAPNQFTNPTRAYSSDNSYATDVTNGHQQGYTNFGLNVAPTATINGVGVEVEAKSSDSSGCQVGVELSTDNGATFTNTNTTAGVTGSDVTYNLGGNSSLWGRAWTSTDFSNGKFVVRLQDIDPGNNCTNGSTLSIDRVRVHVYSTSANTENSDNDNFFVAPTSADMQGIFNYIGQQVCPASLNVAATPPPTNAILQIITQVLNNNGGIKIDSDFTTNVNATNPSLPSLPGNALGTNVTVLPGAYDITENGVAGYLESIGSTCSSSGSGGNITAGETRVCILNNDDIAPPPPPPNLNFNTNTWQETPN